MTRAGSAALETPPWWASLRHGGLLIAPSRLLEYFPDAPEPLPEHLADRLRRDILRLGAATRDAQARDAQAALLDVVLHRVCGLGAREGVDRWERGSDVDARWSVRAPSGETVRPRRVWYGAHDSLLPVFVDDAARLGIGHGRRTLSRVLYWLRASGRKLALLTNARQWRLIYAGLDFDAWAEWDTELWFEEGQPGTQVQALQALLSRRALTPQEAGQPAPLLAAVEASRKGQAELSAELGERVRRAVETLIQALAGRLDGGVRDAQVTPRDVYVAATRLVMRMVVVLFAEARDLLPRSNELYHSSYGLQGLRELLERAGGSAGRARLSGGLGAWPRVLALFRLVYEGSHHEALPVPRYGGALFAPGDAASPDPVRRALAALEAPGTEHPPSDAVVQHILELLCRSRVKVRQGRGSTWVEVPVDFSDLSSEYIGILYEGLLDYELRRADEPLVFLALGDEPLLPLERLEAMDDARLAPLVEKLRVKKRTAPADEAAGESDDEVESEDEDEDGAPEEPTGERDEPAEDTPETEEDAEEPGDDAHQTARERARAWARRAVAKLVPQPKSRKADARRAYEADVERAARSIVRRVVLPGEWFLVRWGGTRKGAGTFYTRPQLAVPTVQRTLRPLAFDPPPGDDGRPDEDAPPSLWTPRRPEEILALKVCDPAAGSGSFLVASLRFLTEALDSSLHHHGRIQAQGDRTLVTLAEGRPSAGRLGEELLPCRPDADDFEPRLRARLKRHVVERCVYGVDLDPLAAELARLALWIETLDRELPFEFLDHKVQVGNALVGCWFDRFRDYPALAWDREGGDKNHGHGVHFEKDGWTKAVRQMRNGQVKDELAAWILGQKSLLDTLEGRTPEALHGEAVAVFEEIHALPLHDADERERLFREKLERAPALVRLREAFDTWCAIWFWPADDLTHAPTPRTFENPSEETRAGVRRLARQQRFFHWELAFPDVFREPEAGFDALVGNPPWEIQKPNSKEYFSNLDPLYRGYGKQEALAEQARRFERAHDEERRWLEYNARFKALSNWVKHAGQPFGDAGGDELFLGKRKADLHAHWAARRTKRGGYSDRAHPFRHQGSADVNTYKLFLELSHALLRRGGQLGMLVPSGVYTDKGSTDLRALFLNRCRWRWLFGFINWNKIFAQIYYRFKFGILILAKGGRTDAVRTVFSRYDVDDWEQAERFVILYPREGVARFSPRSRALLEVRDERDLAVLEKIYANSVLLGDSGPDGWGIRYAAEFHMTNDSKLFPPRPVWESRGYKPDEYGRWIGPDGDMALPLYEGRMIGQFDFSEKGWVSGKGRSAVWREIPWGSKAIEPQYLIAEDDRDRPKPLPSTGRATVLLEKHLAEFKRTHGKAAAEAEARRLGDPAAYAEWRFALRRKVGFMDVTSATNARTMIAALLDDAPAGNSAPILRTSADPPSLCAILNSLAYDYTSRARCGGLHLNYFVVDETPLLPATPTPAAVHLLSRRLAAPTTALAIYWTPTQDDWSRQSWRRLWAVTTHERLRLRAQLDALIALLYGLDDADMLWILRDCDQPRQRIAAAAFYRTLDPKGFWRVDKDKDPELRHTVLTLVAFHDLTRTIAAHGGDRERGIEAFCAQNDGDGWMLPETLRLADYGLGHDERARRPQPVRERLGPRFLPWQLEQSVEESWAECERHARNILGDQGFERLQAEAHGTYAAPPADLPMAADAPRGGPQKELFPGFTGDTDTRRRDRR